MLEGSVSCKVLEEKFIIFDHIAKSLYSGTPRKLAVASFYKIMSDISPIFVSYCIFIDYIIGYKIIHIQFILESLRNEL